MLNTPIRVIGIFAVLAVCAVGARAGVIDDFTTTDGTVSAYLGTPATPNIIDSQTFLETGLGDVLGGSRQTTFLSHPRTYNYGSGPFTTNGSVSGQVWDGSYDGREGFLFLSSSYGGRAAFSLLYDANGAGLDADFSDGSAILVTFSPDHLGFDLPAVMTMTLSDGTNTASVVKEWTNNYRPGGFIDVEFSFGQFQQQSPTLDFANIQSIQLDYLADSANDLSVDMIWTDSQVPEPATMAVLGLGGLAGVIRRRRR